MLPRLRPNSGRAKRRARGGVAATGSARLATATTATAPGLGEAAPGEGEEDLGLGLLDVLVGFEALLQLGGVARKRDGVGDFHLAVASGDAVVAHDPLAVQLGVPGVVLAPEKKAVGLMFLQKASQVDRFTMEVEKVRVGVPIFFKAGSVAQLERTAKARNSLILPMKKKPCNG